MKPSFAKTLVLLCFAIIVGDFTFRTLNPPLTPEYMIAAEVCPLVWPDSSVSNKHLYLRRTVNLTRTPENAWIRLLGHDVLGVYVNGQLASRTERTTQRGVAALLTDITPLLHEGENSIAIQVGQSTLNRPPAVAIDAICEFADGSRLPLDDPREWRANNVYDRRGAFWYETEFEDDHWVQPAVGELVTWRGQINVPPRAITASRRSLWISPDSTGPAAAVFAKSFNLTHTPREGWLRVLATGPYRLAINGWIVADAVALAPDPPYEAVEQTYDVSSLLSTGHNVVSLAVAKRGESPRIRADLEVIDSNHEQIYLATNSDWRCMSGDRKDWHLANPDKGSDWWSCRADTGYLGVAPKRLRRELVELNPPISFWIIRSSIYIALIAICGAAAWFGCLVVQRLVNYETRDEQRNMPIALPYVALIPSILMGITAWFLTWDLAWSTRDFYRPSWLAIITLLVVMQWLLLIVLAPRGSIKKWFERTTLNPKSTWKHLAWTTCWVLVVGVALWLRIRDIAAEPIHHDEIGAFAFTQGVLNYGFPGGQVHPDLPFGYCSTSELAYYPPAIFALFIDDPQLVLRGSAVLWSIATLILIGYMGSRWFNPGVGLFSATIFCLSPHLIGWANLGRYLCQVQFFTLLTMYLTYEAFRCPTVRKGFVWGAAISMAATYLSWEGSGIFGIGLALAVLFMRRNDLRPVISCPSIYAGGTLVILVVAAQNAHRVLQQTQRLWFGEGISDLALKPMWRYPSFDLHYYLMNASWMRDSLLPLVGFAVACFLAVRHQWRIPLRFAIVCLTTNVIVMSVLLPLRTNRYSFHLVPILILLCAAAAVAGADVLWRGSRDIRLSIPYRVYTRSVAVLFLAVLVGLSSGWLFRTVELDNFVVAAFDARQLRYPHWDGPTRYLRDHMQKGDVVIATLPHTQNFILAADPRKLSGLGSADYWLESTLIIQATIGDAQDVARDRRSGSVLVYDVEQLKHIFAKHDRVWYCTLRFGQSRINDGVVSKYMREHMDVVYEDYGTAVLLRDRNHRTAPILLEEDEAGRTASDFYLR